MVRKNKWFNGARGIGLVVALSLAAPAIWVATASAQEPIVGSLVRKFIPDRLPQSVLPKAML